MDFLPADVQHEYVRVENWSGTKGEETNLVLFKLIFVMAKRTQSNNHLRHTQKE